MVKVSTKKTVNSFFKNNSSLLIYLVFIILNCNFLPEFLLSQDEKSFGINDDTLKNIKKKYAYLDSIKPLVSKITISGNEKTDDEVILRELTLRKGTLFSTTKYYDDLESLRKLGLFDSVAIEPVLLQDSSLQYNIFVKERPYIYPVPVAGIVDGDLKKIWGGANLKWDNFRGNNENISLDFGLGYKPFIHTSYTVPWIGEKSHYFTSFSGGYSRDRNMSQLALGSSSGTREFNYVNFNDSNFDYSDYTIKGAFGKYFTKFSFCLWRSRFCLY